MGFLKALAVERRSSLENPQTPLSYPAEWLLDLFNGGRTAAGIRVSEATALQIPAVYACVRIIAEGVAQLPLRVYEKQDRGKRKAEELDIFDMLHYEPNPEMTSFVWRETLQGHLCLWGNAYAEIQRDGANRVIALWPRHPYKTHPWRAPDGEIWYVTQDGMGNGQRRRIHWSDMIHIPGLSMDGLLGMSPIEQARQAMGLALATEKYGAQFFGNGSRPDGILSHPKKLEPIARENLKRSWLEAQGGENAHKVAVLEEGLQWTAVGIPPEHAQFLETRKFQKSEIASIFRVPPHMLADLERATHSNIEQQSLEFVMYTLMPWLTRWEMELKRKLFPNNRPAGMPELGRNAGKKFVCQFDVNGLTRGDFETRYQGYAIARQWGWLSANDVRDQEGMNPIAGIAGDVYLVPMNMTDADNFKAQGDIDLQMSKHQLKTAKDNAKNPPQPAPNDNATPDDDQQGQKKPAKKPSKRNSVEEASDELMGRFVHGYSRLFRSSFDKVVARKERDFRFIYRSFGPVFVSVAEMFSNMASDELGTKPLAIEELDGIVGDYVKSVEKRSAEWTEEKADDIASEELSKAVKSLCVAVYREVATRKAKTASQLARKETQPDEQ